MDYLEKKRKEFGEYIKKIDSKKIIAAMGVGLAITGATFDVSANEKPIDNILKQGIVRQVENTHAVKMNLSIDKNEVVRPEIKDICKSVKAVYEYNQLISEQLKRIVGHFKIAGVGADGVVQTPEQMLKVEERLMDKVKGDYLSLHDAQYPDNDPRRLRTGKMILDYREKLEGLNEKIGKINLSVFENINTKEAEMVKGMMAQLDGIGKDATTGLMFARICNTENTTKLSNATKFDNDLTNVKNIILANSGKTVKVSDLVEDYKKTYGKASAVTQINFVAQLEAMSKSKSVEIKHGINQYRNPTYTIGKSKIVETTQSKSAEKNFTR